MAIILPSYITLSNFQSFDDAGATIEDIRRFNIFVGPNNVGKSKILQCFDRLRSGSHSSLIDKSGLDYQVTFEMPVGVETAKETQGGVRQSTPITGTVWEVIGRLLAEGRVTRSISKSRKGQAVTEVQFPSGNTLPQSFDPKHIRQVLQSHYQNKQELVFSEKQYFFIAAERDIVPEGQSNNDNIEPNGVGVTRVIQRYWLSSSKDTDLVSKYLLDDLNQIMFPDYQFTNIRCQYDENTNHWEIYLSTDQYRDVALSQSGSGLKTIIHLLSLIHLKLQVRNGPIRSGLYIFEELENSLHPRMQRNIYRYIRDRFVDDSVCVFSTHSPIVIDFFQADGEASIYDITQVGGVTKCRRIKAFDDRVGALDSLGVKASDALQSNFVVWVEGPTDRLYLKKWISFVANDSLAEGKDFIIMFYGGKLLSHLTITEDDEVDEFVKLLKINPKCAVVIDSDKSTVDGGMSRTKLRIREEALENSLFCWVTEGREIENYISQNFWSKHFNITLEGVGQFDKIFDAIKGKRTSNDKSINTKIELAAYAEEHMSESDLVLDWERQVSHLVARIREANS